MDQSSLSVVGFGFLDSGPCEEEEEEEEEDEDTRLAIQATNQDFLELLLPAFPPGSPLQL